jgi:hypothetical protein
LKIGTQKTKGLKKTLNNQAISFFKDKLTGLAHTSIDKAIAIENETTPRGETVL